MKSEEFKLELGKSVKLLRLTADYNLILFDVHVSNICKTANVKFKSLLVDIGMPWMNIRQNYCTFFILYQFFYNMDNWQ